jgi:hypothetical protein
MSLHEEEIGTGMSLHEEEIGTGMRRLLHHLLRCPNKVNCIVMANFNQEKSGFSSLRYTTFMVARLNFLPV